MSETFFRVFRSLTKTEAWLKPEEKQNLNITSAWALVRLELYPKA